jgi:hypothetical protein
VKNQFFFLKKETDDIATFSLEFLSIRSIGAVRVIIIPAFLMQ